MFGLECHLRVFVDVSPQLLVDVIYFLVRLFVCLLVVDVELLQSGSEYFTEIHDRKLLHAAYLAQVVQNELQFGG